MVQLVVVGMGDGGLTDWEYFPPTCPQPGLSRSFHQTLFSRMTTGTEITEDYSDALDDSVLHVAAASASPNSRRCSGVAIPLPPIPLICIKEK